MAHSVSSWEKFKLLLWKNWLLEWNHKIRLLITLLLPAIFVLLLIILRSLKTVEHKETIIYEDIIITDLFFYKDALASTLNTEIPRHEILYSPKNPILENLIQGAVDRLELVGFKGFADAQSLENELTSSSYFAGVQFPDSWGCIEKYPEKLSFTLRFPSESRTANKEYGFTWMTHLLFSPWPTKGPRVEEDFSGGLPPGYVIEGFISLQHAITMTYLELAGNEPFEPEIYMQRYPYPPYIADPFVETLKDTLLYFTVLSFIFPCMMIAKNITTEKEKQLKEVMKIMGIPNWIHWTAWFVKSFIMLSISCLLMVILMKINWSDDVAVLTYSSLTALYLFFLVYAICAICFCFMMAVFFSKASASAAITGLFWFIMYQPYNLIIENYDTMTLEHKLGYSVITNTGLGLGIYIILGFEGTGEGLQWDNILKPKSIDDDLTLGHVMLMMLVGAAIFLAICLYVEQIFPGEFGVAKKWNFIFSSQICCCQKEYSDGDYSSGNVINRKNPEAFETEPHDKRIGVQVISLKKKFGEKWAVRDVTLNMYENEICVLLGHNGAGKTTTISMLTGMFAPSGGTALINGHDIRNNIKGARASMGICPQHNVLFDDMSVENHIVFFCRLKGLKGVAIRREVDKYLKITDMKKKANTASANLSGGMKRKLSICCALCGDSKVVLCDEPSSGMDPAARRQLWDLLQLEKPGRTLLLTTHFMDEADVLGDRIAIMCDGEVKCHGTSFFLKKKYGTGYKLICVKGENCKINEITNLLNKYIPGIQPVSDIGAELTYVLPDNMSANFEAMFADLEKQSNSLGLNGYGISITSLEEVFMRVGAESASKKDGATNKPAVNVNDLETPHTDRIFAEKSQQSKGAVLLRNQCEAMLTKKLLYILRNKILFVLQLILPIAFVAFVILISREDSSDVLPSTTISLTQYPTVYVVLEEAVDLETDSIESKISKEYANIVHSYGEEYKFRSTGESNFIDYILDLGNTIQVLINSQYLVAATIKMGELLVWFNNQPLHTAPLALNLMHNAMAKVLIGPEAEIIVSNYPLPYSAEGKFAQLTYGKNVGLFLAINVAFWSAFGTAFFILFIIKENVSRSKLLQFVGGVRVWTFWLSHLLWDLCTFFLIVMAFIVTLAAFQEKGYSTFDELMRYFGLLMIFGYAFLPLTYLLAFLFTQPATGFALTAFFNVFTGLTLFIVTWTLTHPGSDTKNTGDALKWVFLIFPHYAIACAFASMYSNSATRMICDHDALQMMSDEMRCELVKQCCEFVPYFDWENPGVLREVIFMLLTGTVCFLIIIAREYQLFDQIRNLTTRQPPEPPDNTNLDSDVVTEKNRILAMTKSEIRSQNLVLDRVSKYYKEFLAVNRLSLCVTKGECFGLLGINGAGKTTTFKMMTGDERISYGVVYVKGMNLSSDMNRIYPEIGYCPQFDALIDDITGRETLRIYCLLRGIPKRRIRHISEDLAKAFGFMKHIDKPTKTYSGGNKRKLSTAIAVLGSPSIVYLDEPTAGMDPEARRQLWNMVNRVRNAGKSIILTSHSMEECEALCTRLAIMVNGEFKCIGSTQHLKNKFSKGLVIKIKVLHKGEPFQLQERPTSGLDKRDSDKDGSGKDGSDNKESGKEESDKGENDKEEREEEDNDKKKADKTEDDKREDDKREDDKRENDKRENDKRENDKRENDKRENDKRGNDSSSEAQWRADIKKVKETIEFKYPSAVLEEEFQGMLTYYVPLVGIRWSEIFGFIERNRNALNIEDYSISQMTLEEIFLDFANQQRIDPAPSKKKILCCSRR